MTKTNVQFSTYDSEDGRGATLIIEGEPVTLADTHPNYERILTDLVTSGRGGVDLEGLRELLNPGLSAGTTLTRLSERVTFDPTLEKILFDGDTLDDSIAQHIIRIIREGESADKYAGLVRFLEKLYQNPSENSRESLYGFLVRYDFTITPDGDFIAYKGVNRDGTSIHSGPGIVDGVAMVGHLPNEPGSIIEMSRSKVNSDTAVGCSTGLHAGTYAYASQFANGRLLIVKVNPRDVVSVPDDCAYSKIRTCRYEVISVQDTEIKSTTYGSASSENDFVDDDFVKSVKSVVARDGEATLSFDYVAGNGDSKSVADFTVTEVKRSSHGDVLIVGTRTDGDVRTYRADRMENTVLVDPEGDKAAAEASAVEEFFADAVDSDSEVTFSYRKKNKKDFKSVTVTPYEIDENAGRVLAYNADGDVRSYLFSGVRLDEDDTSVDVKDTLRARPDRIVVGEVRDAGATVLTDAATNQAATFIDRMLNPAKVMTAAERAALNGGVTAYVGQPGRGKTTKASAADLVSEAIASSSLIQFRYQSKNGDVKDVTVEPVSEDNGYIRAIKDGEFRTYRLDRIIGDVTLDGGVLSQKYTYNVQGSKSLVVGQTVDFEYTYAGFTQAQPRTFRNALVVSVSDTEVTFNLGGAQSVFKKDQVTVL